MAGKMFFHNRFHVKDYGANFHLQKWQKNKKYLKLGNVNVGLANMRSMLNIDIFFCHFWVYGSFTPNLSMLACESIFLRVLTLTWNKRSKTMTS